MRLLWPMLWLVSAAVAAESPVATIDACDDASLWDGGAADATVKREGAASIRWAHGDSAHLTLRRPPGDLTGGSALAFWLHSEVATGSSFMLLLDSENPATDGGDYYMARLTLDFVGWRRVLLPRQAMAAAREPLGWDRIGRLHFAATGWENTLDPQAVVRIDGLELVDMTGPVTSDEALFDALDLNLPELAVVAARVEAGDPTGAKAALADYYRQRTSVRWWYDARTPDPTIGHNRGAADRTVRGEIQQVTIWHTFPNGEIDWFYNPTLVRDDLPANHEWQWQLGRMHFWGELGRTWWATGEPVYAETFARQLRSWVRACPRPSEVANGPGSAWRTIECGIRLAGAWPDAWHRFLTAPAFDDETMILFLKSVFEQADYLSRFSTSGNWLTMEMNGLYTTGALFPEFRDAAGWRRQAIDKLYAELTTQFLPDGAQIELTPGYHNVALGNILNLPRLARRVGRFEELPDDFVDGLEKAFEYNLKLRSPDDDLPRFNDSWSGRVSRIVDRTEELFPAREDFRWARTGGKEGMPPAFGSVALPHAGYFVMRSGWEPDANYAVLDAGPLGYGHVHQDKLNLVLWSHGRQLLFDGGGGSYERSKWRSYGTDTHSHNTVLVDGLPQRRPGERELGGRYPAVEAGWESTVAHDFVRGVYDGGYGKPEDKRATHVRRVLFVKPDLFVVADTLTPNDGGEHTYQARWHLRTTQSRLDGGIAVTTDEEQPNLAIVPLLTDGLEVGTASAQMEPELLGWWVDKDVDPQYKPATTVLHTRRGAGVQQFLTLLIPLRAGESQPVLETEPRPDGIMVRLRDEVMLKVTADLDPNGSLALVEIQDGEVFRAVTGGK